MDPFGKHWGITLRIVYFIFGVVIGMFVIGEPRWY